MSNCKPPLPKVPIDSSDSSFFDFVEFTSYDSFSNDESSELSWVTKSESKSQSNGSPSITPIDSPPTTVPRQIRRRYGQGIDARRASRFRVYDVERSTMYQYLRFRYNVVTKKALLRLVIAVFQSVPPSIRPPAPTRIQKRSKTGLIAWIDQNAEEVLNFLAVNPLFS
jgi:hypothetical protein